MLPPFLGVLLLLGTAASVALALGVWLWARARNRATLGQRAAWFGGGAAAVYAMFWVLGLVLTSPVELAPGQTVCFGGLDCHLHVAVTDVHQGDELGVTVQFSSDARGAPEWPGTLRFRIRDATGMEYAPTNAVPDSALGPGETRLFELRFPGGVAPIGSVLIVTWKPGVDYLVPGSGNPLVQARRRLALPAVTAPRV